MNKTALKIIHHLHVVELNVTKAVFYSSHVHLLKSHTLNICENIHNLVMKN